MQGDAKIGVVEGVRNFFRKVCQVFRALQWRKKEPRFKTIRTAEPLVEPLAAALQFYVGVQPTHNQVKSVFFLASFDSLKIFVFKLNLFKEFYHRKNKTEILNCETKKK